MNLRDNKNYLFKSYIKNDLSWQEKKFFFDSYILRKKMIY